MTANITSLSAKDEWRYAWHLIRRASRAVYLERNGYRVGHQARTELAFALLWTTEADRIRRGTRNRAIQLMAARRGKPATHTEDDVERARLALRAVVAYQLAARCLAPHRAMRTFMPTHAAMAVAAYEYGDYVGPASALYEVIRTLPDADVTASVGDAFEVFPGGGEFRRTRTKKS